MKKFKAVVRSISPFLKKEKKEINEDIIRRRDDEEETEEGGDEEEGNEHEEENTNKANATGRRPTWKLDGIDFREFLRRFYLQYNPEKISAIDTIVKQFSGDEMVMIYQLAEKYKISQNNMQAIIDEARSPIARPVIQKTLSSQSNQQGQNPFSYRNSSDSDSLERPDSTKYNSVVTPQWKSASSLNKSLPKVTMQPVQSDNVSQRSVEKSNETEKRIEPVSIAPSVPTTLQDIINASRQNDPFSKKVHFSQRISTNISKAESLSKTKNDQSHNSIPPSSIDETSANTIHLLSPNSTDRSSTAESKASLQNHKPIFTVAQKNTLSSYVSRESVTKPSINQSDEKTSDGDDALLKINISSGKKASDKKPIIRPQESSQFPETWETTEFEELTEELESVKRKLAIIEHDCDEMVQLLEAVVISPLEMQEVVESYLENYRAGEKKNVQALLQASRSNEHLLYHDSEANRFETSSVTGSTSSRQSFQLNNLEGSSQNSLNRSALILPTTKQKPYMLGTASSTKRGQEGAQIGKSTGNYAPYGRLSGVSSPYRSLSTQSQLNRLSDTSPSAYRYGQTGGNKIRPTSSGSASLNSRRNNSLETSSRNSSPLVSNSNDFDSLDKKYQFAKNYFNRQSPTPDHQSVGSKGSAKDTPKKVGDPRDDWVEYTDPKTKKKYYYSASRKKSTWVAPPSYSVMATPQSLDVAPKSQFNHNRSVSPGFYKQQTSNASSIRSASPANSIDNNQTNIRERANSAGSVGSNRSKSPWVCATDPKSGKNYWYNRLTKESTWKKPMEENY